MRASAPGRRAYGRGRVQLRGETRGRPEPAPGKPWERNRERSVGRNRSACGTHLVMLAPGSHHRLPSSQQYFAPAPLRPATAAQPAPAQGTASGRPI